MTATLFCFLLLFSFTSCGSNKGEQDVGLPANYETLKQQYDKKLIEVKEKSDVKTGWRDVESCDAMLWAGKYACGGGDVNLAASEYPDAGRFGRRPLPDCWNESQGDVGSKTTWSRDMGMGLIAGAWCKKELAILERHADYGSKKNWMMGEPLADGRAVYTPSIIGILYQAIYSLGGKENPARVWPSVYSTGLDDYQAHLQMLDIWLRGESDTRQLNLDISKTMFDRVKEHSDREPDCAFYQYLRGIYDGNLDKAASVLVENKSKCQYVRGFEGVEDVEWLFSARLVLKKIKHID